MESIHVEEESDNGSVHSFDTLSKPVSSIADSLPPYVDDSSHINLDPDYDSDDSFIQDTEFGISDMQSAPPVTHTQIVPATKTKLNYGGYRNTKTNIEYHNAIAQTTTAYDIKQAVLHLTNYLNTERELPQRQSDHDMEGCSDTALERHCYPNGMFIRYLNDLRKCHSCT